MMPIEHNFSGHIPPISAATSADETGVAPLVLMAELEASLQGSHKALLALDLAGIEYRTKEQIGLLRKFNAFGGHTADGAGPALAVREPALAEELRRSGTRVLQAARLQSALLARARSKLRVLANMLAGPSVAYGPFMARNSVPGTGRLPGVKRN